jgi:N-methylhydantoinase B
MGLTLRGVAGANALVMTHGAEVPNSVGLFGGWPGATVRQRFASGEGRGEEDLLREHLAGAEPSSWQELGPKPGEFAMRPGDVFAVSWQGGGGWGDPLSRSPEDVGADVERGVVSAAYAEQVYGVVLTEGAVDGERTRERRLALRTERLGSPPVAEPDAGVPGHSLGPALRLVRTDDGDVEVRTTAGAVLARGSTHWRSGAVSRRVDPATHHIRLHDELAMTAHYCPRSGELLSVDVHRRDEEPLEELSLAF